MFAEDPKARSDFRAGTLYAIWGVADWIYYGQVAADKSVAFFNRRDRKIAESADVLASPIMSRVIVSLPSMGQALRSGVWKKLGKYPLEDNVKSDHRVVQWPVGTLDVTVWTGRVQAMSRELRIRWSRTWRLLPLGTPFIMSLVDWRLTMRPTKQAILLSTRGRSEGRFGESAA